jgi:hypothetical protein
LPRAAVAPRLITYESLAQRALGPSVLFFNTFVEGAVFVIVVRLVTGLKTQLSALLPMCSSCKKIRHEPDASWEPFEVYLRKHSSTQVSHGMCPDCMARLYPEYFGRLREQKA